MALKYRCWKKLWGAAKRKKDSQNLTANLWWCMQNGSGYRGLNIRGARVGGVEIPNSKRIETALQYIHGVGSTTARQILLDIGLENKLARELTEEDLTSLRDEVSKYMVEGDLVRKEPHCLWSPALLHSRFLHLGFRVYQVLWKHLREAPDHVLSGTQSLNFALDCFSSLVFFDWKQL